MEKFERRVAILTLVMLGFTCLFVALRAWKGPFFLPNFEWVLPALVVSGSIFPKGRILPLLFVQVLWIALYGPKPIQVFTCSGFALVWFLARKNPTSPFVGFRKIVSRSLLTCAAGILLYDFWTGVLGWSLLGHASLYASMLGQIPFSLYHLCSLVFVPPLLAVAKLTLRIKVPVVAYVPTKVRVRAVT